jgi:DNA-binding response OmpR family regulator
MAKILLVEDNETMRNMLARRLVRKGYEVLLACDGREGIAMASRERPALILICAAIGKRRWRPAATTTKSNR